MDMMLTLVVMLILSLAGIYTCRLILLHLMNRDSPLGAKLCSNNGKFNCDRVLGSDLGKLSKNIHLGDLGLVYFIFQSLFLILTGINGRAADGIGMMIFPCLLAFVSTFLSLLYQAFIIKAWCKMCLIIISIIWLQGGVLVISFAMREGSSANYFLENVFRGKGLPSFLMLVFSVAIASAWFFIATAIAIAGEVNATKRELLLFKSNSRIFRAMLRPQRAVHTDLWKDDFLLGNKEAPIQLVAALNPYCPPCAREYTAILQLLDMFPGSVGVAIRFPAVVNIENKPTQVVRYLLHAYGRTPKAARPQILERWFAASSLEDLERSYPDAGPDWGPGQNELLQRHQQWFEESKITHTPTLFINGQEFPKLYTVSDLKILIPKFLQQPLKTPSVK